MRSSRTRRTVTIGSLLMAVALITAACSDSEPAATQPDPTTAATPAPTSAAPTTQPAAPGEAAFAITAVRFGDDGFVEITNTGTGAGILDGWFLCQRPSYHSISGGALAPGESVQIMASGASFGSLDAADGEMGLYRNSSFGDSSAIAAYVEWGSSGHGRSSVAVAAEVWPEGGFVDTTGGPGSIVGDGTPTPDAWRVAP